MSNEYYSTVRVNRDEYNRLQREASSVYDLNQRINQLTSNNQYLRDEVARTRAQTADVMNQLQQANARATAVQQQLHDEINNAYRDCAIRIDRANQQFENRLRQQANEFDSNLNQLREDVADSIEANNEVIQRVIDENNQELTRAINNLRSDTSAAITQINNELNEVHTGLDNIFEHAQESINAANEYMQEVERIQREIDNTRHQILLPGKYEAVLAQIQVAAADIALAEGNDNLNPVEAGTARNNARAAFASSLGFLQEVLVAEQEWQVQYAIARQLSGMVEDQIQNSQSIEVENADGQTTAHDVNHWSNGDFDEAQAHYTNVSRQLKQPDEITTQQLRDMQQAFMGISDEIDVAVANATINVYDSQEMADLAQDIADELNQQNLNVTSHGYVENDQRGDYHVVLRNDANNFEVTTLIRRVANDQAVDFNFTTEITSYGNMDVNEAERVVEEAVRAATEGTPSCDRSTSGNVRHQEHNDINNFQNDRTVRRNVISKPNSSATSKPQAATN